MAVSFRTEKLAALQDGSYPLLKFRTQGLLSKVLSPIQISPSLIYASVSRCRNGDTIKRTEEALIDSALPLRYTKFLLLRNGMPTRSQQE